MSLHVFHTQTDRFLRSAVAGVAHAAVRADPRHAAPQNHRHLSPSLSPIPIGLFGFQLFLTLSDSN